MNVRYPVTGYGLYLNKKETDEFVENYLSKTQIDNDDKYKVAEQLNATNITLDEESYYEVCKIEHMSNFDGFKNDISEDGGMMIPAKRQGSIFATNDNTLVYADKDEMISEFKESIGKFLPDNFNYADHLAYYRGNH